MPDLYRNHSSNPKNDAQRNLCGRTHYVDDDTLRYHKSRVLSARITNEGLLFAIVTSDALTVDGSKRGFRYVVFDVFGTVVARVKLEDAFSSSNAAVKAMWNAVNALDAKALTLAAADQAERHFADEMNRLRETVRTLASPSVS